MGLSLGFVGTCLFGLCKGPGCRPCRPSRGPSLILWALVQVGPQAGPGSQPGPKPNPHPGLTSQAQGGWGKVCVCAHLGPKGGPGHPWTSLYLPLQTGRFSRRERISLVGRVSGIAVVSKISAEIAAQRLLRADISQIFYRYFADITEISLGFCPSINKSQFKQQKPAIFLRTANLPSDLATHNVRQ